MRVFLILLLICQLSWGQEESKEETIEVTVGIDEVIKLDFKPFTRVEIGNPSLLTYTLIPDDSLREITFKGLKPGVTSAIIRDTNGIIKKQYRVNVTTNSQSEVVIKLREFFKDIEGVEVVIVGGIVVVRGELIVPSDAGLMATILEREEFKNVVTQVQVNPQTQRIVAERMQDELRRYGMRDVTVRVLNRQFWLEGFVTKQGDRELAEQIAYSLLPDKLEDIALSRGITGRPQNKIVQNFISNNIQPPPPPAPKIIKITAQFVELIKDYRKSFGFKWQPALAGDGGSISFGKTTGGDVTTRTDGTLAGTISNLFPKLASAKSSGNARVVQQGMLLVKGTENPQQAEEYNIRKRTKIPFPLGSGEFQRPQEANATFDLKVRPVLLADENVEMSVTMAVSVVQATNPPIETENVIKSTTVVRSGDSAVLGGITLSDTNTSFDKDPPFGEDTFEGGTPLFNFLRSKDYQTSKSQFVVFLTPQIIESASQETQEIRNKFRRGRR